MRITPTILSIPPYISTSWKNIAALQAEPRGDSLTLIVTLHEGSKIEVPNLEQKHIDAIFAAHAKSYDLEQNAPKQNLPVPGALSFELPMKFGQLLPNMEGLGSFLQHSQEQYDTPDLPADVLNKISQLTGAMGKEQELSIPKAEPHCNCPYCQIARAMTRGAKGEELLAESEGKKEADEELVSDEDLTFRSWDILQTADQIYTVTNPIDAKEHYNVFLGSPIGCTCGNKNCEHIRAVLNS